ncbi:MAG TPA: phytoene/squalene synthase family protein, partial [Elusimicrobiales bacterium]|nr:phytoene/squalene synthase family protein [Elusimicrobiales bacterium]
ACYAFSRAVDDIADDPGLPPAGQPRGLLRRREAVARIFSGAAAPDDPLGRELAWAALNFPLKQEHFLPVLDGMAQDLEQKTYATFSELERYMHRVAAPAGMACLAVCGYDAPGAALLAEKLGSAVQLTNILRDAGEDYAAGRVYLPAQDLARFGCRERDLGGSNYTPNFIELMRFEAGRAEELYSAALDLAEPELKSRLAAALAMRGLYRELLAKLRRRGFRVKGEKIRLSAAEKFKALFSAWQDYRRL